MIVNLRVGRKAKLDVLKASIMANVFLCIALSCTVWVLFRQLPVSVEIKLAFSFNWLKQDLSV